MTGNSRRQAVIFLAVAILAAGQLACTVNPPIVERFPTPEPTPIVTAAPPAAGFAPSADPKADLLLAYDKLQSAYPYRITETSTNSSSTDTLTRIKEAARPGEQHVTWTSPAFSGEMIETGGMFYLFLNGQWSKSEGAPLDVPTEVDLARYFIEGLSDAQFLGLDSSIGVEANAYSYNTDLEGNPGAGKVWLGTSSGLPYQATYKSTSGTYTFTAELTYEYGLEVTITAPIP